MSPSVGIRRLNIALHANQRRIANLRPHGAFGRAIKDLTIKLQRYAIGITHVWPYKGGGLRASHRMMVSELRGVIFIAPGAVNPRGQKPAVYGPYEDARGGTHAFYGRTATIGWAVVGPPTLRMLGRSLVHGS